MLISKASADLIAIDSPPDVRFPRLKRVLRPADGSGFVPPLVTWSMRSFPRGPWFDLLELLAELFLRSSRTSQFPTSPFDLIFGVKATEAPQASKEASSTSGEYLGLRLHSLTELSLPLACAANVATLREKLELQRYEALVSPSGVSYRPLITLRRALADVRVGIVQVQEAIFSPRLDFCALFGDPTKSLREEYASLLEEIDKINKELNDDIQLIIGAVTIQDSEAMKQQAQRATLLTLLAAIYLPLTLVAGIFGMNIREINGGIPTFRTCLQALAVTATSTAAFVFGYSRWKRWQKAQEQQHREEEATERQDLEVVFNEISSRHRTFYQKVFFGRSLEPESTSKIGKTVESIKRRWENAENATILSKIMERERRGSPGATVELGGRE